MIDLTSGIQDSQGLWFQKGNGGVGRVLYTLRRVEPSSEAQPGLNKNVTHEEQTLLFSFDGVLPLTKYRMLVKQG